MECSICYEQFIQPTSDDNRKELEEEFDKNHNDYYKWFRYCALLILPNGMPKYKCPNDKCCKYMCDYCYEKTINELGTLFKCHYCRVIDYKTYMNRNVLPELQFKVLGKDGFIKLMIEQISDI